MDRGGNFMSNITNKELFQVMEEWAPKHLAYDWDNVGLQVGSQLNSIKGVLITLDVNEAVVDEAIEKNANVIIAHHPMIFRPIKSIDFNTVKGRVIKKLIEHNITVYASHTNLDIARGGVNDLLSNALGLKDVSPLITTHVQSLVKLVVFTPVTHVQKVVNALSDAGAGHIGNYSHCTFQSPGEGTFKPLEGTNPFIGTQNEITHVEEVKVETIVPENLLQTVIQKMKQAHPYEEAAYDIVSLKNKGETLGIGRIGSIDKEVTLEQLIKKVKEAYHVDQLRFVGDLSQKINRVAILGGSGEKYIDHAIRAGADVYITGDMTFHPSQDAEQAGLSIIDPGHYIEKIMKKATKEYLEGRFPELTILESKVDTEPFQFM